MKELREYIRIVSTKGQVTIPVEVRRLLRLRPQDKVVFRILEDRVELSRVPMTLGEAFGSITPLKQPEDFEEMRDIAAQERAEHWTNHNR
jgi:AbrB family looped-hinge helix DNA binding protein